MESQTRNLGEFIAALVRYRGRMAAVAAVLAVATLALALGLPPVYRSTGTILIEQQEIPQEMVRSTITSFADQRIHVIGQRVMTRANLTDIIHRYDLYADDRRREPMEEVLEKMRTDIKMSMVSADVVDPRSGHPTQATIAFTVSYDSPSPALAQKVSNELVSLYLNENLKTRTEAATEASGFLTAEVDRLTGHISEVERKLAVFKERNVNQLPELAQLNLQLVDRTEREIMDAERDMRTLRERRSNIEAQIAQISPETAVYTQTGERIMGPADRLKQLETKYLGMRATYGEDYPDLVRMRKEIDALREETGGVDARDELLQRRATLAEQLDEDRKRYAADHPEIKRLERELAQVNAALGDADAARPVTSASKADNPAYIQLKTQLDSTRTELAELERKTQEMHGKWSGYEKRMAMTPEVEREFRELTRDYDNSWASYKELKAKQLEAQLAQVMESERKGERFTLVEPPELPEKPLKPKRAVIAALGIVASLAGGVGTAAVSNGLDNSVRDLRGLGAAANMVPLGAIPRIETDEDLKRRGRRRRIAAASLLAAAVAALLAVHYFFMPLDVLWYVVERRMGMGPV